MKPLPCCLGVLFLSALYATRPSAVMRHAMVPIPQMLEACAFSLQVDAEDPLACNVGGAHSR